MTDFDWTQINYFELSRWFPPRLRSKEGKKVRTKTFGYIDYFPNGTSKAPMLYDMLNSRNISFTMDVMVATRHNSDNIGIVTICFDRNHDYLVHAMILNIKTQIKVLYGAELANKYIAYRADTYRDMFGKPSYGHSVYYWE